MLYLQLPTGPLRGASCQHLGYSQHKGEVHLSLVAAASSPSRLAQWNYRLLTMLGSLHSTLQQAHGFLSPYISHSRSLLFSLSARELQRFPLDDCGEPRVGADPLPLHAASSSSASDARAALHVGKHEAASLCLRYEVRMISSLWTHVKV